MLVSVKGKFHYYQKVGVVFDEGHLVEYALKSFNIPFKANDDGATINEIATKRYS